MGAIIFGRRKKKPKPVLIYYTPAVREVPTSAKHALSMANKARDKAYRRIDEIRAQVLDQVDRGVRYTHNTPIGQIVDSYLRTDPYYKLAVADNRWYLDYAAAFGATAEEMNRERIPAQGRRAASQEASG